MSEVLFDEITRPGVRARVIYDEVEEKYHFHHTADVEPNLEHCKRHYNGHGGWKSDRTGSTKDGMLRHVAHIPAVVIMQLMGRGIDPFSRDPEHQRRLRQFLNDGENRFFRTTPGTL